MENLLNICSEIISVFNKRDGSYDFDSHEFISIMKLCYPKEYYSLLLRYITNDVKDLAFKQLHQEIGKYLSANQNELHIQKEGKHKSPNYHGIESENEKWTKI